MKPTKTQQQYKWINCNDAKTEVIKQKIHQKKSE